MARWGGGVDWDGISEWIDNVAGYAGDRLLRAKGFLSPSDVEGRVLVDGVGGVFAPPRPITSALVMDDDDQGLVMILRDMDPAELVAAAGDAPKPELRVR